MGWILKEGVHISCEFGRIQFLGKAIEPGCDKTRITKITNITTLDPFYVGVLRDE